MRASSIAGQVKSAAIFVLAAEATKKALDIGKKKLDEYKRKQGASAEDEEDAANKEKLRG